MMADYRVSGKHRASLPCLGCAGEGKVRGAPCAVCEGGKTRAIGCGNLVEVDQNHPNMCNCLGCGRFIDPTEVTLG